MKPQPLSPTKKIVTEREIDRMAEEARRERNIEKLQAALARGTRLLRQHYS